MDRPLYPFTAVVGQEQMKKALLCLAVEPKIGGVLLCGEKGTAKSTLVRAMGALDGVRIQELPLNATEDMLLGGVDMEEAVKSGRRRLQPGLLSRADGAILYADEVNLLPAALTSGLLDALETGLCRVERDGISETCAARFSLVGSMNPEEGMLRPQLLDRFGLYVKVTGEEDKEQRKEVVRRILDFERDPVGFRAKWATRERNLNEKLAKARELLPQIKAGEAEKAAACQLARQANAAGHRAEITILHTARALAALAGRSYINLDDLNRAAELALPHRRREGVNTPPPAKQKQPQTGPNQPEDSPGQGEQNPQQGNEIPDETRPQQQENTPPEQGPQNEQPPISEEGQAKTRLDVGEDIYEIRQLGERRADRMARRGSGRRNKTRSSTRRGRAVGDRIPNGKAEDISVSATLRAAAPFQLARGRKGGSLIIKPGDFRVKIRECRAGADIVFAVDASGSMGAARRMKEVKEAVLSMLMDSYQKRDRVGMVVFRGGEAQTVLDITRSVELAQRELQALPTGGRTPLAAGITEAVKLLEQQRRRVRESMPLLVLITDGRANFSEKGGDPVEEALNAARRVAQLHIPAVVIDTERQFITLGLAAEVAKAMGAHCYRVEELRAKPLAQLVREHSPAAG